MDNRIEISAVEPGFEIELNVLSSDECDALLDGITNQVENNDRAGIRNLMRSPAARSASNDPRLISIASRFLGGSAVPFRATLFEKSGRANWLVAWHQDTVLPLEKRVNSKSWGPWSSKAGILYAHAPAWALERVIALRIHLDNSTVLNGPLRVVPGTHVMGVLPVEKVLRVAHARKSFDCISPKGGVIAMRPLLIHASSKLNQELPRRVLHIEYADALHLSEEIQIAIA